VFVAIENVYSMDGTITPLFAILDTMDEVSPAGNTHPVVNEAHAMGLYGPGGRGIVALLGWRTAYSPGCIRLARRS
jgi:8-amino-7-oxononanoate synthase